MAKKNPGYNPLTTFKRSCLIFFLVIFTGTAVTSPPPGTPPKNGRERVKTLDYYQKKLCDTKKSRDERELNNFISEITGFRKIGDIEYSEDYLKNAAVKKIRQFKEDLKSCKHFLLTNPKIPEETSVEKQKKINDVLRGINKILWHVNREEALEKDIRVLYDHLKRVRHLHLKRTEWPPEAQCPKCSGYWQIIKGIASYKRRFYEIIDKKNKTLKEIPGAIDKLKIEKQRICHLFRELKDVKNNIKNLDKDFKYYSWTKTRVSVDKILELLNDKDIKRTCRKI